MLTLDEIYNHGEKIKKLREVFLTQCNKKTVEDCKNCLYNNKDLPQYFEEQRCIIAMLEDMVDMTRFILAHQGYRYKKE
jgi:hypothetical protein